MTREELIKIVEDGYVYSDVPPDEVVDRILAALEKEREGEVVLGDGAFVDIIEKAFYSRGIQTFHLGVRGQLIFRPTKEAK